MKKIALTLVIVLLVLVACKTNVDNNINKSNDKIENSNSDFDNNSGSVKGSNDTSGSKDNVTDDLNFSEMDQIEKDLEDFNW